MVLFFRNFFRFLHLHLLLFKYSRMGLAISVNEIVNTNIQTLLRECGFVDSNDVAVGIFANAVLQSTADLTVADCASAVVQTFELKLNAKVAVDESISAGTLSMNANVRLMKVVLGLWKQNFPGKPIPTAVKQQMQRLVISVISYLFF